MNRISVSMLLAFMSLSTSTVNALAQSCDPSVLGNPVIKDPAKCRVQAAARDGVVITLLQHGETKRIDPAKVPQCTSIGSALMKQMDVVQEDFFLTRTFASTSTFRGRCATLALECQVSDVSAPIFNKASGGRVAMRCDVSADRITGALQIIAPTIKKSLVRDFVTKCLAAARAGKSDGPTDREDGSYMLICDPQNRPDGPEIRVDVQ